MKNSPVKTIVLQTDYETAQKILLKSKIKKRSIESRCSNIKLKERLSERRHRNNNNRNYLCCMIIDADKFVVNVIITITKNKSYCSPLDDTLGTMTYVDDTIITETKHPLQKVVNQ